MQFTTNIIRTPIKRITPFAKVGLVLCFVAATLVMFFFNDALKSALTPWAYKLINFAALVGYLVGCFGLIRAQNARPKIIGKLFLTLDQMLVFKHNQSANIKIDLNTITHLEFKYQGYQSFWFNPTGGRNYLFIVLKDGTHYDFEIQIINRKDKETLRQLLSILRLQYGCVHIAPLSPNASLFSNFDTV